MSAEQSELEREQAFLVGARAQLRRMRELAQSLDAAKASDAGSAEALGAVLAAALGFDSLAGDPLGGFTLELEHIEQLTRLLVTRAEAWCGGRLVSALEGGYDLSALAESSVAHVGALLA